MFLLSLLSLFLLLFFKNELKLKELYPTIEKIFIYIIYFYITMIIIGLFQLINWPNEDELDLIKYPPDNMGPGIIKLHFMVISEVFFLNYALL